MEKIIEERVKTRERAIEEAREFAKCASRRLGRITAILYGSYARGDFNEWSDIDVLIVAESLPRNPIERLNLVEDCVRSHPRVEPVLITLEELNKLKNKNPAVIEAFTRGLVLVDDLKLANQRN
ncbi:MAG: nucleotidyltransferase domain-containing protein [Desulfurococcaceae archaeon]|nr:nucleotidyltransferase domain-containing protein [Desulfurococcaceae archaeon]